MCALFNNSVLTGVAGGLTQGVQMATMLQYIVGVWFSTCVTNVYLKSFIPERRIYNIFLSPNRIKAKVSDTIKETLSYVLCIWSDIFIYQDIFWKFSIFISRYIEKGIFFCKNDAGFWNETASFIVLIFLSKIVGLEVSFWGVLGKDNAQPETEDIHVWLCIGSSFL